MSNHMKPCITCKHRKSFGYTQECYQGATRELEYSPVYGTQRKPFYALECKDRRGAYGDCKGDLWEPTLWGRFKAAIKRILSYACQ